MTWLTHQLVAVGVAFALRMPVAGLAAVWVGAVLPDVMDQKVAGLFRNRQRAFNQIHRGPTHWFGWWLVLWLLGLSSALSVTLSALWAAHPGSLAAATQSGLATVVAGVGFGGLMHVALDMCTFSGVPIAPWTRQNKISLRMCRTGGVSEYVFLAVCAGIFWLTQGDKIMALLRGGRLLG